MQTAFNLITLSARGTRFKMLPNPCKGNVLVNKLSAHRVHSWTVISGWKKSQISSEFHLSLVRRIQGCNNNGSSHFCHFFAEVNNVGKLQQQTAVCKFRLLRRSKLRHVNFPIKSPRYKEREAGWALTNWPSSTPITSKSSISRSRGNNCSAALAAKVCLDKEMKRQCARSVGNILRFSKCTRKWRLTCRVLQRRCRRSGCHARTWWWRTRNLPTGNVSFSGLILSCKWTKQVNEKQGARFTVIVSLPLAGPESIIGCERTRMFQREVWFTYVLPENIGPNITWKQAENISVSR